MGGGVFLCRRDFFQLVFALKNIDMPASAVI